MMSRRLEYTKEIIRPQRKIPDGFDYPEGFPKAYHHLHRFHHYDCEGKYPKYPYGCLTTLYARLGLHRYNLLEGKNLQLDSLKCFNMRVNSPASSYYITLSARDPDQQPKPFPFQVLVHEGRLGSLDVTCPIARPIVTTTNPFLRPHTVACPIYDDLHNVNLPDWPSEIAFNDTKRFHLLNESEWIDNDWIRLYLELTLVFHNRTLTHHYLSQLEIVQVAIETIEYVELPNAKTAIVYIAYKDFAKADHKVIVRRLIDAPTGHLTLRGFWSGENFWHLNMQSTMLKEKEQQQRSKKLKRQLGVPKLWRLSNPMLHQAFKKARLSA